jgi:phosphopantothenate-cysteine ligase
VKGVNYLVTAGGTSERIDGVRSITNFATGRLGALIADRLARQPGTGTVFYVCGKHAVRPPRDAVENYRIRVSEVEGVADLEVRIREILRENTIGAVVHSMAVSDYQVDQILDGNGKEIVNADKISSSERELHLILKPAKKIIGLFHALSPGSLLVGFKLLNNAPETVLREAAYRTLAKNHCHCVLANDLTNITGEKHGAFLIDTHQNMTRFETKAQIADGICDFIRRNGRNEPDREAAP